MSLRNQPYFPMYVQDFLTDEKLMECSALATGVFIKTMCIMHKSDQYGTIFLKDKDKQYESQIRDFAHKLTKSLPWDAETIEQGLFELVSENVMQIEGDFLIQKRMVKDNETSIQKAAAGKQGAKKRYEKSSPSSPE